MIPPMPSILQSPARHPVQLAGDKLVCTGTGRRYSIVNGTPHLYDEMDVSPFLRRDYQRFDEARKLPPGHYNPNFAAAEAAYARAKAVNTDWMFALAYPRPLRVLEVGVGAADLIKRFGAAGHEAWAMDFFTWEMESHQDGSYRTISAPMSRLPFRDGAFDLVYFHAAIHHALPNDPAEFEWSNPRNLVDCLAEVRRILKPEGAFWLLGEGLYPDDVADRVYEKACQADPACVYEAWYTLPEYEQAFSAAGIFPNIWLDQENLLVRAHTYSWLGARVPLVTLADEITEGSYDRLLPRIASATGISGV